MAGQMMKGAEPYLELRGNKGILFLHGFTGSPHEFRWIAKRFAAENYSVSVPLLAGHGTIPEDLKTIFWQDWFQSAKDALFELKKHAPEVVVVGLSMGATLGLHLAAHYEIRGVAALAAAFYLNDWRLKFLPVAKYFLPSLAKSKGVDIKDINQKQKAVHYNDRPLKAIEQLLLLFKHVKDDIRDIHIPTLLIYSKKDHVVPIGNLKLIEDRISSIDLRKIILEESYHGLTLDIERNTVLNNLRIFIEELLGKA